MQGKVILQKGICPRCHGTGKARQFNKTQKYSEALRTKATQMYQKGFSLREIAQELKMKHPQTVKNLFYK